MNAAPSILVVDDSETFCTSVRLVLEDEGYSVVTASSGPAALDLLGRMPPPSLVLLDVIMPGMNGLELARTMKARRDLASIPIVLVSSVIAAEGSGLRLLTKPLDLWTLLAVVREHEVRGVC